MIGEGNGGDGEGRVVSGEVVGERRSGREGFKDRGTMRTEEGERRGCEVAFGGRNYISELARRSKERGEGGGREKKGKSGTGQGRGIRERNLGVVGG